MIERYNPMAKSRNFFCSADLVLVRGMTVSLTQRPENQIMLIDLV
jgi:hypothetical protein